MFIEANLYKDNTVKAQFQPSLTDIQKPEVEKLIKSYDWYTAYIDDGTQYKMANKRNEHYLEALKSFGMISFELIKDDGSIERKAL